MKKIYFLLLAVLVAATAWSKTTTWIGGVNSNWDNPANWDNGVPATDDIVIFPTNVSGTINRVAQGGDISLFRLSILGNSNIRFVATGTRLITIKNGTGDDFVIETDARLSVGNNVSITLASGTGANPTRAAIDGTLVIEPNRSFDSDNNNVLTTVTGTIENTGTVLGTSARMRFEAGSNYFHARNGGSIPRANWDAASTSTVQGIINSTPGNMDQSFGNLTWNCPLQLVNFNLNGALTTVNGNFTLANTNTGSLRLKNFGGAMTATTIHGDYIQTGGRLFIVGTSESHNLNLHGNFEMTGGEITRGGVPGAGSVAAIRFIGSSVQTFSKSPAATISNEINFQVVNNAKVDFGTSVLNGSTGTFSLLAGGKIITSHANGLGANGSIQIPASYRSDADYEFRGPRTGVFATSTPNTVRDLVINNTDFGGDVLLDQPLRVNRTLYLTEGTITTNETNLLTIGTSGNTTPALATSFVNGPLAKTGSSAFTFPVGKAGDGPRPIGISTPTGSAVFRAEFVRSNPGTGTLGTGITQISACEYWDLTKTGGGSVSARVTLSWSSFSPCGSSPAYVTDPGSLRVAHYLASSSTWVNEGNSATSGDNTSGTVTSANMISAFSPFTLASSTVLENPLPVVFANVRAYEKNSGVQIEWSNLTEKDVASYTVERSANGTDFSAVASQAPTSNQDDRADYSAFDANPISGTNYYRIKAEETTGKIVYSKVLSVNLGLTTQSLRLYPNPVVGRQVNISLINIKRGQYDLRVVNVTGQDVYRQKINSQGSTITETIDLPKTVAPGVYTMLITGADYRESKLFIVQ